MKCEIVGLIRLCILICDIGRPLVESRSINDLSNLKSLLPCSLSTERAVYNECHSS